ncbi:MAG: sulfate adenylyltransferase subunit 1 [Bacteroidia bacterium]|jgi:sulfate adenylyltransferase subunit 1
MEAENIQLLKFTTAGNVDSGKSTLIGRLLYDSNALFQDQISAVRESTNAKSEIGLDLAMFTDGLREERQMGITIDVAHRYFSTSKRKFIIIDSPGHTQYTRNMITGASLANVAIIIIDASDGIKTQTKRHAYVASLLQIEHIIVCVNKMDLIAFSESKFKKAVEEFEVVMQKMGIEHAHFIPINALSGDNVVFKSDSMPWYNGLPLLEVLEKIEVNSDLDKGQIRFPIQTVIKSESTYYLGYGGKLASGMVQKGDEVVVLPSGKKSRIKSIRSTKGECNRAFAPMSIVIELEHELQIGRGDMIAGVQHPPRNTCQFEAIICWMGDRHSVEKASYYLLHTSNEQSAAIEEVVYTVDIDTMEQNTRSQTLSMNTFAKVLIRTALPVFVDAYADIKITGSIILIDAATNETVAVGMIL